MALLLQPRAAVGALSVGTVALVTLGLTGCTAAAATSTAPASSGPSPSQVAEQLLQVTSPHDATGMTLLEGPTIGPDGDLYVVDVTAPAGEPKVLRIDVETADVTPVYTDESSVYTSAQFSPLDGRIYLTDFGSGKIDSMAADGTDHRTFFSGAVDGATMHPDDLAFDEAGNLFITDSAGYDAPEWEASGRIVRVDAATASASVLASELPAPNGISFDLGGEALWVSNNMGNRVDYLRLNEDRTAVTTAHPAFFVDAGRTQVDSNAVDAAGNVYQAMHGDPRIHVYSPTGERLQTISLPSDVTGVDSATNLAIAPGTTEAYLTASGPDGGFVYRFDALAEGIRQSNGG